MSTSKLVHVPTSMLYVDSSISATSPKGYTQKDLTEIATTISVVYEKLDKGWTQRDFALARMSNDPGLRRVGSTYEQLWQDPTVSRSLHAIYDGQKFIVQAGNHRVLAAQHMGVPVMPVWIHDKSAERLKTIDALCQRRRAQIGSREGSQPRSNANSEVNSAVVQKAIGSTPLSDLTRSKIQPDTISRERNRRQSR